MHMSVNSAVLSPFVYLISTSPKWLVIIFSTVVSQFLQSILKLTSNYLLFPQNLKPWEEIENTSTQLELLFWPTKMFKEHQNWCPAPNCYQSGGTEVTPIWLQTVSGIGHHTLGRQEGSKGYLKAKGQGNDESLPKCSAKPRMKMPALLQLHIPVYHSKSKNGLTQFKLHGSISIQV